MKHRSLYTVAAAAVLACTAGCTTGYQNAQQCKAKMVETYPASSPKLDYEIPRVSYRGTRVVVEGTYILRVAPAGATPIKTTKTPVPAAVECTFDGDQMRTFQWLAPATLAAKYPLKPDQADTD
ncbi:MULTISPECIES: hypothetical protein [Burkholderiaceae]|jgi:hypothetical protein|uniref:Lipoprotein n=1 Tax=Caballeronia sordidicola TaxID=196367 RepID=A0A242NAP0_CABSO|nr:MULTISPECIES: hypothetical protein [Burkholderiaceae]AME24316.1 hypothetical protein AXG89_11165 [Burkholderia sp. PAMC 26561]AMM13543.1 hypothetical protein AX768_04955 [Burkholderia sp. PAMC 28687]MDP9155582.1 hypothetical protein [Pseudomonadota bacterium]OTP80773.1 hypothetical protein PAMC26510_00820 [Caballeronia sordidicola]